MGSTYSYLVKDVYSRESVVTNDGASPSFSVDLAPGEGKLFRIEPWDDSVTLDGDVTIPTGVTLRLARGATVQFDANSDDTNPENDNDGTRSELIVAGTLNASAGEITFRSSNDDDDASRNDWYGIHVESGGSADLSGATIRDASRCVQSHDLTGVTVSAATTFEHCARTVGLSPTQPQVDHLLTATLTGLDETVTGEHWQWQRRRNDEVPWVNITLPSSSRTARQTTEPEAYPALTTYTPVAADFLHELRVTLRYVDGGLYNYAQSEPTSPVVDVPPQPTAGLEASGGPAGIGVEWSAVTATPEVTKYRLAFQRLRVGAASWPQEYTSLATIPNRRTSYTQNSDANGDPVYPGYRYRYRLRAHNDVGPGAWSAAFPEAGVIRAANRPDPDGLVLDDESAGLVATWACPNHNFCGPSPPSEDWTVAPLRLTAEIKSGTGSWTAASATVSGVQTTHAVSGLERGTVHEFRTLAVNVDDQEGSASEAVALVPLRKTAGDGRVELAWDSPGYSGLAWQYRSRSGTGSWGDWQPVSNAGATAQPMTGLTNGVSYRFQVQGVKGTTPRAVSFIEAATPQGARTVSFGLASYTATEGGAAATVTVRLSPAATEALSIPIRFDPSSGDYSHDLGTGKTVTFAQNGSSQTFTVTADQDTDWDDESVTLSFGTLPSGVTASTPASSTVSLVDDDAPEPPVPTERTVAFKLASYSATEGGEAVTVTATLSPAASDALNIPIRVTAATGTEADDYAVSGLTDGELAFAEDEDEATFTVTANQDADRDDESVNLSFGTLPSGVVAGTPATATVSLVDDDDAPGVVTVRPSTAQVGTELTARLSDADEVAEVTGWQWHRRASDQAAWTAISGATAAAYTPVSSDAGQYLQATVGYTDGHGPDKSAASAAIGPVQATGPTERTVAFKQASYSASEGGEAETVTVRLSPAVSSGLRIPISVDPRSGPFTLAGLGTDTTLTIASGISGTFTIRADQDADRVDETVALGFRDLPSGVVAGTPSSATVTLVDDDELLIVGASDTTFAENGTGVVAAYTATDANGHTVTWSIHADGQRPANADSTHFAMGSRNGQLTFRAAPDFEDPDDTGHDNVYLVTVQATDNGTPPASTLHDVSVTVTNVDEPGQIEFRSTRPQVGVQLLAAITDPDGNVDVRSQQWEREDGNGGWEDVGQASERDHSPPSTYPGHATYTPVTADVGKRLRVTVGYLDGASADDQDRESVQSGETHPVVTDFVRRLRVEFDPNSYNAVEGGDAVTVTVRMTPAADRFVHVPIRFQPSSGDYSETLGNNNRLSFELGDRTKTFTITATSDSDRDDETVTLGFGDLPAEVVTGTHASATVNLDDTTPANRPPVIDDIGTQSVPENRTSVATFTGTDPEDQAITWSVSGNVFEIGRTSGEVSFQTAPNYESGTTSYSLTVRATDPKGASDTETVTVNVTDVDEPPGPPSNVRVSAAGRTSVEVEWDAPNTSGKPPVKDYDVQRSPPGTWKAHPFLGTGTSTTISSLDPNTAYEVQVNATNDEGTSGWAAGSGRTDCGAPTISGPTSQSIPENTTAVASYSLSDPDGGGGRWLPLAGADASSFHFSSGTLSFRSAPDYETDSRQYQVTIRAQGGCSKTASRAVTVNVTNVVTPRPTVSLSVPSSGGHKNLNASWSVSSGGAGLTGYELQYCTSGARDDGESPANSGGQDPSARAVCSTNSFGSGTTSTTLSGLKSSTLYSATARATSSEGTGAWSVPVSAFTRANTAPVISGTGRQNVNENTTAVGTYTATDAEGDGITWDIYSTDSDEFSFTSSGSSLTLRFESAPDYENPTDANTNNIYVVRIRATDDANPSANSNKLINAIVQDIGPPSRMTDVRVSVPSSGTGRLDVNWSAPGSGATVTGYTMKYCYASFRSEEDPPEDPDDEAARQAVCAETTVGRVTSTTLTGLHENTLYTVFLKATSREGTSGSWSTPGSAITRSAAAKALAAQLALTGLDGLAALAAPNPFNPSTTLYFQVPESGEVSLVIYSLAGQVVKTLIRGRTLKAGIYDVFWEGRDEQGRPAAAGVYFYRLRAGDKAIVRKMTLLR